VTLQDPHATGPDPGHNLDQARASRTTGTAAGLASAIVVVSDQLLVQFAHLQLSTALWGAVTVILTYFLGRCLHLPTGDNQ
jgi:hypothetical protein